MNDKKGLTSLEAKKKLRSNGKNIIKEDAKTKILNIFLKQVFSFENIILSGIIIVFVILTNYTEAVFIAIVLFLNVIIGLILNCKAQETLKIFKNINNTKSNVIRDGKNKIISSKNLVVGDYIILNEGQIVPADVKLIETNNLQVNETILTGVKTSIIKDSKLKNKVFCGTEIISGYGYGIVEHTGTNTQIGKIVNLNNNTNYVSTPLQKSVFKIRRIACVCVAIICALIFFLGKYQQKNISEMLLITSALAVAAIPEGITSIIAIVMATAKKRTIKYGAFVKKTSSIEKLSSVDYICLDKTDMLTQNKMIVVEDYTANNVELKSIQRKLLITGLLLCNNASIDYEGKENGSPEEIALIKFGQKNNISQHDIKIKYPKLNERPFDFERKLTTTVHKYENEIIAFTKGSTDTILKKCKYIYDDCGIRPITENDKSLIINRMLKMSNKALYVLSIAIKPNDETASETDLTYIGLVGMYNPIREDVKYSIDCLKNADIKIVIITEDHKNTTFAIAKQLKIANDINECITGCEIDNMSDAELIKNVQHYSIFAQVSSEHKVRIIKAIQKNQHSVSIISSNTADSLTLIAADVGITMGTDIIKNASDVIIQDDSLVTLEMAIREGRGIYENIKKVIIFSLSSNIGEVIAILTSIILKISCPFKILHILWINFITDSLPCYALGNDVNSSYDIMKNEPGKRKTQILSNDEKLLTIIYGIIISIIAIGSFLYLPIINLCKSDTAITVSNIINQLNIPDVTKTSQTYSFSVIIISELFQAISLRDIKHSLFKFNWMDNKLMLFAVGFGIISQIAITRIPQLSKIFGTKLLSFNEWKTIFYIGLLQFFIHELIVFFKFIYNKIDSLH